MYLLGIDLGTSSIKISVVDVATQQEIASTQYPDIEASISSPKKGWAEQDPAMWWHNTQEAIKRLHDIKSLDTSLIQAIGISYQMHGLVMIDKNQNVLRPSIIWCDSRAVEVGERAFDNIGHDKALKNLLNSPGNFTASKLAWVKENEPNIFEKCDKMMLPGDYLAMMLTGDVSTTISGLSEGIFWDFNKNEVSKDVLNAFGFNESIIPTVKSTFANHGELKADIANDLCLKTGIKVAYKAGDQPNNALSLNVLNPGEIAATAGTSGVVYAVSDQISCDAQSRINSFAHVNHRVDNMNRIGILLCINGTGILNRWLKDQVSGGLSYAEMNQKANEIKVGSQGLVIMPFGNGAERMLQNKNYGSHMHNLDFNIHSSSHIFRAGQEGIVFSLKYGFDMMQNLGVQPKVIRAGHANMFLSDIFSQTMVNTTQVAVEMYDTHGAKGAALAAGVGAGIYKDLNEAMQNLKLLKTIEPDANKAAEYAEAYQNWVSYLNL